MTRNVYILGLLMLTSCSAPDTGKPVKLVTLDPGHFHAALVQKSMYPEVDSTVHVYAPAGNDLHWHLGRIESYSTRAESPTTWNEVVYTGDDFFEKMIAEKKGNVVVLSGNNKKKTEYILKSLEASFHVFADKPMAIDAAGYEMLKTAFKTAKEKNLLLYDIMTERFEITTILQREFSLLPEVFGVLDKGSPENPALSKESVHHFYKNVSGSILTRPAWFLDTSQQGEGIVDVTTHLVDLVQWACFPERTLDTADVAITSARRWTTAMSLDEFKAVTKLDAFPDYLTQNVMGDTLRVYSNGEINYQLKGINAKVSVLWNYKAPEGTGDTHYSIMRGTRADLVIRQGAAEGYKPELYIEPLATNDVWESAMQQGHLSLQSKYPGIELQETDKGWKVVIPDKYREGHEAHFARVTEKFLEYLSKGNMPAWEVPNMIVKYYTTTKAREVAMGKPMDE